MILKNIEKYYLKIIERIKKCENAKEKRTLIGMLCEQLDGKGLKVIAKLISSCFKYVKKCYSEYLGLIPEKCETRGRKPVLELFPNLLNDLKKIIENDISTDPRFKTEDMYVRLTLDEIRKRLINNYKYDYCSCPCKSTIATILNGEGYKLAKIKKTKPLKKVPQTDTIFENVAKVKQAVLKEENTVVISIDAKDKVAIGEYSRGGKNRGVVKALDHDLTNKLLTPFGILDLKTDIPHFYNTTSKVTALFITDVIRDFWINNYKDSNKSKLVIFLDNGPENASGRTYFIKGLIDLVKEFNITIELCYYPPYHSKYNPVERLWSRLENIWNGYLLSSINIILNFMTNLTWKGQKSTCSLINTEYKSGLTLSKNEMDALEKNYVTRSSVIPKYSLIINP